VTPRRARHTAEYNSIDKKGIRKQQQATRGRHVLNIDDTAAAAAQTAVETSGRDFKMIYSCPFLNS